MQASRPLVVLALVVGAIGCVSGSGDTPAASDAAQDTARDDGATDAAYDTIFPLEDAARDVAASEAETDSASDASGDIVVDTAPTCGAVGGACCGGAACVDGYCNAGTCYGKPTILEEASNPGLCADLGTTHLPPSFLSRYTIRARPGALAYRYYIKVSCAGAVATITPESPLTIGSDGSFVYPIGNTATSDCTNKNLGRYELWVVVDGQESAHHFATVFESSCPSFGTCALGASACP